jgi:hypothetical protein
MKKIVLGLMCLVSFGFSGEITLDFANFPYKEQVKYRIDLSNKKCIDISTTGKEQQLPVYLFQQKDTFKIEDNGNSIVFTNKNNGDGFIYTESESMCETLLFILTNK